MSIDITRSVPGRMSAALATFALLAASQAGHFQNITLPTTTRRGRRYEVPVDSRVQHLANMEISNWNDQIERKKAERKGAK
jgi:hypothetical protein